MIVTPSGNPPSGIDTVLPEILESPMQEAEALEEVSKVMEERMATGTPSGVRKVTTMTISSLVDRNSTATMMTRTQCLAEENFLNSTMMMSFDKHNSLIN